MKPNLSRPNPALIGHSFQSWQCDTWKLIKSETICISLSLSLSLSHSAPFYLSFWSCSCIKMDTLKHESNTTLHGSYNVSINVFCVSSTNAQNKYLIIKVSAAAKIMIKDSNNCQCWLLACDSKIMELIFLTFWSKFYQESLRAFDVAICIFAEIQHLKYY